MTLKTKQEWMDYALELEAAIRAVTYKGSGGAIEGAYIEGTDLREFAPILERVWEGHND